MLHIPDSNRRAYFEVGCNGVAYSLPIVWGGIWNKLESLLVQEYKKVHPSETIGNHSLVISIRGFAKFSGYSIQQVRDALPCFAKMGAIRLEPRARFTIVHFTRESLPPVIN